MDIMTLKQIESHVHHIRLHDPCKSGAVGTGQSLRMGKHVIGLACRAARDEVSSEG